MLSQWERYVFVYDLRLRSHPEGAPKIDLEDAVRLLQPRQEGGDSVKLLNKETAAIRIQGLRIDPNHHALQLLINYSDKDVVDPVFGNLQTGTLRLEPKLDGEGIALSCHMVIALKPSPDGSYLVILEDVPGVGRTKIGSFLTSELKNISTDFMYRDITNKIRKYRPIVALLGHQSQKLREGLEEGILKGIELVRTRHAGDGCAP